MTPSQLKAIEKEAAEKYPFFTFPTRLNLDRMVARQAYIEAAKKYYVDLAAARKEIEDLKEQIASLKAEVEKWQMRAYDAAADSFTSDQVREMLGRAIAETIEAFKEYQLPQNRFYQELYKDLTILEIMAGAERAKENSNQKPNK